MKKIFVIAFVFVVLVCVLFANSIIPSYGVRDAGAYPVADTATPAPPTATYTPEPPFPTPKPTPTALYGGLYDVYGWTINYTTGPLGEIVAYCSLCAVNYTEDDYEHFLAKFTFYDTELGWVQRYGFYSGRTFNPVRAVYEYDIPLSEQYLDGCFVIGPPHSGTIYNGSAPVVDLTHQPPEAPRICGLTIPLLQK